MDYLEDHIQDLDSTTKKNILFHKIQEIIHWINENEVFEDQDTSG